MTELLFAGVYFSVCTILYIPPVLLLLVVRINLIVVLYCCIICYVLRAVQPQVFQDQPSRPVLLLGVPYYEHC